MELFNPTPAPDHEQDALLEAMTAQWEADKKTIKERRVIPDWIGEPEPLSKDRAALLEYLYEHGCIFWTQGPSKEKVRIAKLMGYKEHKAKNDHPSFDLGFPHTTVAVANAKAVIDDCHKQGLIEMKEYQGRMVYQLSAEGEFALGDFLLERELGFL